MKGYRPYSGRNRNQIKELITSRQAVISKEDIPKELSIEYLDCFNLLLQR